MKQKFLGLYLVLSLFFGQFSLSMQDDLLQQGRNQFKVDVNNEEIEKDILSDQGGVLLYDSSSNSNFKSRNIKVTLINSEEMFYLENALNNNDLKMIKNALSHVKSFYENWNVIKEMINLGADIDDPLNIGWSPLMIAASNGDLNSVKWLINNGADVDYQSNFGWNAILSASICGYLDIVKFLVGEGANVNILAENGLTPLMVAAFAGSYRVVDYLVDNGAKVEAVSEDGSTAPQLASSGQHWDIVDFLKKFSNHEPVMMSPLGISLPTEDF